MRWDCRNDNWVCSERRRRDSLWYKTSPSIGRHENLLLRISKNFSRYHYVIQIWPIHQRRLNIRVVYISYEFACGIGRSGRFAIFAAQVGSNICVKNLSYISYFSIGFNLSMYFFFLFSNRNFWFIYALLFPISQLGKLFNNFLLFPFFS